MIFFMDFPEVFLVNVGIYLGGCHVGVSEHFLDASEVGAALEEMGAETVSEGVGCNFSDHTGFEGGFPDNSPDFGSIEFSPGS